MSFFQKTRWVLSRIIELTKNINIILNALYVLQSLVIETRFEVDRYVSEMVEGMNEKGLMNFKGAPFRWNIFSILYLLLKTLKLKNIASGF
jgi:hypothetical protein